MTHDPRDATSINVTAGILVTRVEHALTPAGQLIADLDEPLYVIRVSGPVNGGGERTETLLLRPSIAAHVFVGNVVAAEQSDTMELFERHLSEHMRRISGNRANLRVLRTDRLAEN